MINALKTGSMTFFEKASLSLYQELEWLGGVIKNRMTQDGEKISEIEASPDISSNDTYSEFIINNKLKDEERLVLILALAPHIDPVFFDNLIQENLSKSGDFPQLGGVRGINYRGFLPTGQTAVFLLAGSDLERRFEIQKLFDSDKLFAKKQVLWLQEAPIGEPAMSGRIVLSQEYVEFFTIGSISRPRFGINFPAQFLETLQEWDDLVLHEETMQQVKELEIWIKHNQTLLQEWGMVKKLKPGYRALFHGPPGTGKTLTASLLGKYTGKDVYKIDLSMVVSKFIGETEKNLANLFDKAENKDWILFFDEADALFGKRTNVRDAHDKYANQEVSFLLQRVENFSGLAILATNFKSNIDDAFNRRFQAHIYFPMPKYAERLKIWHKAFPANVEFEDKVNMSDIAQKYELAGSNIMNVVHYSCLKALARNSRKILWKDVYEGLSKEYHKEGKVI